MLRQKIQKLAERVLNISETEIEKTIRNRKIAYQNKFKKLNKRKRKLKKLWMRLRNYMMNGKIK